MAATSVAAIRGAPAAAPAGRGVACSGGVPAGGLNPTLPPAKSRQVFPRLRGGRRGGEAHPALRTQGPGLRKKKKKEGFCPWPHIWPGEDSLQPPEGTDTVIRVPPNDLQSVCTESPLRASLEFCQAGQPRGMTSPFYRWGNGG